MNVVEMSAGLLVPILESPDHSGDRTRSSALSRSFYLKMVDGEGCVVSYMGFRIFVVR